MTEIVYALQQQRYDSAANWVSNNPVLLEGEIGVESDTGKFKFGNGISAWNNLAYASGGGALKQFPQYVTSQLAAAAVEDFTIASAGVFQLLSLTTSTPAWVRVYGTAAARNADTRTSPGGTVPPAGTEFYAELVTTTAPQTIRLSPVPLVQPTSGEVFVRVKNMDSVSRVLTVGMSVLAVEGGSVAAVQPIIPVVIVVPASEIIVSALAPAVGAGAVVTVPSPSITVAALAPAVGAGAVVAVPAANVAVTAVAPTVQATGGSGGDPDFANVSLLLHMDGSNGSTTFADFSSNALAITANGNAQISTAQSKFGGASLVLDGSGDWLNTASSASPQSGDYTVECFIRPTAITGTDRCIFDCRSTSDPNSSGFVLFINSSGRLQIYGSGALSAQSSSGVTANVWQHIALVSSGGTVAYFIDGVAAGSFTASTTAGLNTRIGARQDGAAGFIGYIDDLRITKNVARYTANFTPPAAPFPDSAPAPAQSNYWSDWVAQNYGWDGDLYPDWWAR